MKPIGGFFELENYHIDEYYPDLIKLNTSRNAFEYILRAKKYKKVWLPWYTCDVMLESISKLNISHEFYHIDEFLEPVFDEKIAEDECFVYTNYFGLKNKTVDKLAASISNLIVDNAQAFFAKPLSGIDTIYSVRKFFGVPDGGYLQTNVFMPEKPEQDISYKRMLHLLKRIDLGPEESYTDFVATDKSMENQPIRSMSQLTEKLLSNINYERAKQVREKNFLYLHDKFKETNKLSIDTDDLCGPMVYPYLVYNEDLKKHLIDNKIFVATYWPNTFDWCTENMWEYKLAKYLVPIPIDQRYGINDMEHILQIISTYKI